MRIKITLSADKPGIVDFNYQHQIQAIIYGFLNRSNPDYAQWLHQQGFIYKKDKRFKLFVFSGITFDGPIKIIRSNRSNRANGINELSSLNGLNRLNSLNQLSGLNGLNSFTGLNGLNSLNNLNGRNGFSFTGSKNSPFTFSFQIASPVDKFIQHLIDGIFHEGNEITLGRQKITIYRIETLPDPVAFNSEIPNPKSEILLKPLESPIFIKKPMPPGQHDIYLFPGDEGYEELLNQNLVHKYETLYGRPYEGEPLKFDFRLERPKRFKQFEQFKQLEQHNRLERLKPKLVKSFKIFKNGKITDEIKGTLQPFAVTGPRELIRIGLECGFGQNNSMGCGYVETFNEGGQDLC